MLFHQHAGACWHHFCLALGNLQFPFFIQTVLKNGRFYLDGTCAADPSCLGLTVIVLSSRATEAMLYRKMFVLLPDQSECTVTVILVFRYIGCDLRSSVWNRLVSHHGGKEGRFDLKGGCCMMKDAGWWRMAAFSVGQASTVLEGITFITFCLSVPVCLRTPCGFRFYFFSFMFSCPFQLFTLLSDK